MANSENVQYHRKMAALNLWFSIASLALVPVFIIPLALPLLENFLPFDLFMSLINFNDTISSAVINILPFNISVNIVWSFFAALFALLFFFFNVQRLSHDGRASFVPANNYTAVNAAPNAVDGANNKSSGTRTQPSAKIHDSSGTDSREDLVKLFADTKKKLDTMGKDLAFLSIDIMDSTGMKQGEEKAVIEHDFREYKLLIEDKIKKNEAQKSAWTPDGVMICFSSLENALSAAKDVIIALKDFNANVKVMKQGFRIRCGINSGFVYCDESMPMAEMSDRVIDIAGHMQKYAAENSIFMSRAALFSLLDRSGFKTADTEVDGLEAFIWKEES